VTEVASGERTKHALYVRHPADHTDDLGEMLAVANLELKSE
jgi:hypothetical protein